MQQKKPPDREQKVSQQVTVRMPEDLYESIKAEAEQIGSSFNSFLMVLVSMGMKVYNSTFTQQISK